MPEDYKNRSKRVAICLITNHNDDVLMGFRREEQSWCCPGGHLEPGEDPFEGACRELLEETSLDVDSIKLIGVEFNKEDKVLLYLFKIHPHNPLSLNPSNDPDQEFEILEYMDPNDVVENLHIPLERNMALKYWMNH
jgi:8-oxo-dGTP pyrophosphatase MutT (NUDIX family)